MSADDTLADLVGQYTAMRFTAADGDQVTTKRMQHQITERIGTMSREELEDVLLIAIGRAASEVFIALRSSTPFTTEAIEGSEIRRPVDVTARFADLEDHMLPVPASPRGGSGDDEPVPA